MQSGRSKVTQAASTDGPLSFSMRRNEDNGEARISLDRTIRTKAVELHSPVRPETDLAEVLIKGRPWTSVHRLKKRSNFRSERRYLRSCCSEMTGPFQQARVRPKAELPKRIGWTFAVSIAALALSILVCTPPLCAQGAARHYYLDQLIYPHDYVPGKNSFVFQDLLPGERKTLIELPGSGSIRHLWFTWTEAGPDNVATDYAKILIRVFVDGEARPSLAGPIDEICLAAETQGSRYAPQPAFNFKRSFNLYLPIYFANGIRIEIQSLGDFRQFYTQLDYRITRQPERSTRLTSESTGGGLTVRYVGPDPPACHEAKFSPDTSPITNWQTTIPARGGSASYELTGPAVIRQLAFEGDGLDDLDVAIRWDDEDRPAVMAPLRYLFGGFETLALETRANQRICYFPMPFRKGARLTVRNRGNLERAVMMRITLDRKTALTANPYHFHAQFREIAPSLGYRDFAVVATRGEGHFVGITLFDSGHDHGGGDTALLDADTISPHVLHGICGEDYFSFAWFGTGRMHMLAGAPEQSRRYRFHLENPYPFHSSMIFTFGVFAGLHPKAVAFWYQKAPRVLSDFSLAPDAPWKIFGPVGVGQQMPNDIGGKTVQVEVPIVRTERFAAGWRDTAMSQGFVDLSHHYRHYIMQRQGTGFIIGRCRVKAVTFIQSPRDVNVEAIFGHDDAIEIWVNDVGVVRLPAGSGFLPSIVGLRLRPGWNKLSLVLDNDENTDWRWLGFSLALRAEHSVLRSLKFSTDAAEGTK
jgi:hypothetical protein